MEHTFHVEVDNDSHDVVTFYLKIDNVVTSTTPFTAYRDGFDELVKRLGAEVTTRPSMSPEEMDDLAKEFSKNIDIINDFVLRNLQPTDGAIVVKHLDNAVNEYREIVRRNNSCCGHCLPCCEFSGSCRHRHKCLP
jgi:radical SAM superfamily enzyme